MTLCTFAQNDSDNKFITIQNSFIERYLASANESQIKVYLYGLYLCSNPLSSDNSIDRMLAALNIKLEDAIEAFTYWKDLGLVYIASYDPLQIQYLSTKNKSHFKKYPKEKYSNFNNELSQIFSAQPLYNENTYLQFYDFMEKTNITPEVFLMIIKYCVNLKGQNISPNYILTVATSWIKDGIRTIDQVETRLKQYELNSEAIKLICTNITKTSPITTEDKDLYIKWTEDWKFELDTILLCGKKSTKTFAKLDLELEDCYKNGAIARVDVEQYLKDKKKLKELAISIANKLGSWYDNTTPIVENYIIPWKNLGYEKNSIEYIANYCFKHSIKKLEQMDSIIKQLFKDGIISIGNIEEYYAKLELVDKKIEKILTEMSISRPITNQDRDFYKIWTSLWNLSDDIILYAAKSLIGKPYQELPKLLSKYKENNITKLEEAKTFDPYKQKPKSKKFNESDKSTNDSELVAATSDPDEILKRISKNENKS